MRISSRILLLISAVLIMSLHIFAQIPMFHIHGTVSSPWDSLTREGVLVPRSRLHFDGTQPLVTVDKDEKDSYLRVPETEITFSGEKKNITVVADQEGSYSANLPFGSYEMIARGPTIGAQALTQYRRFFRVMSTKDVILNGALYVARGSCDTVATDTKERTNICGGEDSFRIPAKDGTPFVLEIRFGRRQLSEINTIYNGVNVGALGSPVFVAYNLWSLEAREVTYSARDEVIVAKGDVAVFEPSGQTLHSQVAKFKIENGEAKALP